MKKKTTKNIASDDENIYDLKKKNYPKPKGAGNTNKNPITKALALKKNTQIDLSENLKNESNFIKYLETLQLKSYKDKLFMKNDSVI